MKIYKNPYTLSGFQLEVPDALGYPFSHVGEYLFIKEWTLGIHEHKTWEFLLQIEGTTFWTHNRRQIEVSEGELLICPPGVKHGKSCREVTDFRFYFLGCKMDMTLWNRLKTHLPQDRLTKLPNAQEIARYFRIVEEELLFDQPRQKEGVILAWKQFWLAVYRLAISPERAWNRKGNWLAHRVRTLVEANPGERWRVPAMARLMGYAPNHFAALFKRESGMSFHRYITKVRIEAAKTALSIGEETITDIALRMGFSSSQHFSRVFLEKTRIVPSRWGHRSLKKRR